MHDWRPAYGDQLSRVQRCIWMYLLCETALTCSATSARRALRATRSASAMAQSAAANGSAIAEGLPNAFSDG